MRSSKGAAAALASSQNPDIFEAMSPRARQQMSSLSPQVEISLHSRSDVNMSMRGLIVYFQCNGQPRQDLLDLETAGSVSSCLVGANGMLGVGRQPSRPFVRNPKITYPHLKKKKKPAAPVPIAKAVRSSSDHVSVFIQAGSLTHSHSQTPEPAPEPEVEAPPGSPTETDIVYRDMLVKVAETVSAKRKEWEATVSTPLALL